MIKNTTYTSAIVSKRLTDLLGNSRELEDIECLIVHGGTLVDVDNHTGFPPTTEETLEVVG